MEAIPFEELRVREKAERKGHLGNPEGEKRKFHLKAESKGEKPSRVLAEFDGFLVEIPPDVAKAMFHNPPEIPKVQKWAAGWARG